MVVQEGKPPLVFVTTGDNINIVQSTVDALSPQAVARNRVKKSRH